MLTEAIPTQEGSMQVHGHACSPGLGKTLVWQGAALNLSPEQKGFAFNGVAGSFGSMLQLSRLPLQPPSPSQGDDEGPP